MNLLPFVPKKQSEMPDFFGIEVFYVDGTSQKIEAVSVSPVEDKKGVVKEQFEIWTKDNLCVLLNLNSIKRIEYDSKFSKIIELKNKIKHDPTVSK